MCASSIALHPAVRPDDSERVLARLPNLLWSGFQIGFGERPLLQWLRNLPKFRHRYSWRPRLYQEIRV